MRPERGQVGGIEAIPFGLLVFLTGALVVASLWSVVDARVAVDAAAREGARALAEGVRTGDPAVGARAERIIRETMADHGRRRLPEVSVTPAVAALDRCDRVRVTVGYELPAVRVPFLGGLGPAMTVRASHTELVDPLRSGVGGEATCLA